MIYDPNLQRVLLLGGTPGSGLYPDVWAWDGVSWTELTPADAGLPRYGAGVVWDGERLLAFGGDRGGALDELFGWRRYWGYALCRAFATGSFSAFLAGAPLVASNGARLGALCVLDREPHELDLAQRHRLVLHTARHDEELTFLEADHPIAQMDFEAAAQHEE